MEDISISILLFVIFAGFLAAFIDSVVGGGGLISVPALLTTGMPPLTVLGTNKLASSFGSFTSSYSFWRAHHVDKKLVLKLLPLTIIGSVSGVFVVQLIPPDFLKPIIIFILIIVTIYTLSKKDWGLTASFSKFSVKIGIFIACAACIIGFYDGFFGPGTGSFLIFAFLIVGFDFLRSAGSAKVLNFGSNISALAVFWYFDAVNIWYGLPMGLAMVAGSFVGARLAIKKGTAYVKLLFLIVTGTLITKLIWDYLSQTYF